MTTIKLSARLGMVAGFIGRGSAVADIGTDHGHLPVYLAQTGLARSVIASDISTNSLASARRSAMLYGVADRITFIAAAGLDGVSASDAGTITIAGVGGETTIEILKAAPWTKDKNINIVLQPQTKLRELLRWLFEHGYALHDAELARDRGRLYVGLLVKYGGPRAEGDPETELLTILCDKRHKLFPEYIDDCLRKAHKASEGLRRSESVSDTRFDEYIGMLNYFKNLF